MRKQTEDQARIFSRRLLLLGAAQVSLVATLAGRLYYLQVAQSEKYKLLAEENRINLRLLAPIRGEILDRNGVILAGNEATYRATLTAEKTEDVSETLVAFSRLIALSGHEATKIQRDLSRSRSFVPITVKEDLSWPQVSIIQFHLPNLPGIDVEMDQNRHYPLGSMTSHLLGYVVTPSEADLAAEDGSIALLQVPGFRIGKTGLEKEYDSELRGSVGHSQLEVNSRGRIIQELGRTSAIQGPQLKTTIDAKLQEFTFQRLSGEASGSCVVMDVHNGDVLTLASAPSYDPKAFIRGLTSAEWQYLSNNEQHPLINKVIAGQYAPGSTFKMITALAAMRSGISPSFTSYCSGSFSLGDALFHCWKKEGHGDLDMQGGIRHSCDVYFYQLARRLTIGKIAEMARLFGLGQATGVDLPGEKKGLIPDEKWKKANIKDIWHPGETVVASIGQGYTLTTPLQLCLMTAQLANGGNKIRPRFVRPVAESGGAALIEKATSLGVDEAWLRVIVDGMNEVVNAPNGTAYRARIQESGFEMAGKTGTAQVRRISRSERLTGVIKNDALPWRQRDHALFVAFAPVHQPRFACAVVIEHGGGGSAIAAPIARDVLLECQRRNISV